MPPGLPGDFNNDGSVDAADYVLFRQNEGTTTTLPNDNGIGGTVGQPHYDLWRAHYGENQTPGGGSSAHVGAVPEPSSTVLLLTAIVGFCCNRRGV